MTRTNQFKGLAQKHSTTSSLSRSSNSIGRSLGAQSRQVVLPEVLAPFSKPPEKQHSQAIECIDCATDRRPDVKLEFCKNIDEASNIDSSLSGLPHEHNNNVRDTSCIASQETKSEGRAVTKESIITVDKPTEVQVPLKKRKKLRLSGNATQITCKTGQSGRNKQKPDELSMSSHVDECTEYTATENAEVLKMEGCEEVMADDILTLQRTELASLLRRMTTRLSATANTLREEANVMGLSRLLPNRLKSFSSLSPAQRERAAWWGGFWKRLKDQPTQTAEAVFAF